MTYSPQKIKYYLFFGIYKYDNRFFIIRTLKIVVSNMKTIITIFIKLFPEYI